MYLVFSKGLELWVNDPQLVQAMWAAGPTLCVPFYAMMPDSSGDRVYSDRCKLHMSHFESTDFNGPLCAMHQDTQGHTQQTPKRAVQTMHGPHVNTATGYSVHHHSLTPPSSAGGCMPAGQCRCCSSQDRSCEHPGSARRRQLRRSQH